MTMKYLFLILVCYAVKCENVGSNYFVVEMPEENLKQQDIKDFKKPFQVYWNVPTMQCASKKIPFENLYEKYGIVQNDNDRFIGDKIVIIYNEIDFPAIIYNKTSGINTLRNGGVPQEGDLDKHLIAFENELKNKIPDPYFDGIGIIDFESWRPVFRQNFGSLVPHRHLSIEIEKKLHDWWPKMWIEREASLRFEAAARKFMQTTLAMVKEMRPNALWGYYGFPYCFNMRGRDMTEKCAKDTNTENDSIYWLWAESTALFPSLYSSISLTSSQLSSLIKGRVKETARVKGKDTPFFPYFWFKYRDDAEYITEKDLRVALNTLYESNASGFIIWGSSNDVNTVEKCNNLYNYVETVLGPNIAKYTKRIKMIYSDNLKTEDIYFKETSTPHDTNRKSTQILNNDRMYSTEYNKYISTDESSQTLSTDEMFLTENSITYNEEPKSDNPKRLNVYDVHLSESLINYMNTNQSIQTINIKKTSPIETSNTGNIYDNIQKNSKIFKNNDIYLSSSQTSTDYSVYDIIDQSSQTLSDDEMSASKISTSQISNIDNSNEKYTIAYNMYFDTDENVQTLNRDNSTKTLNIQETSSTETLITENVHNNIEETTKILNNEDLFSSSSQFLAGYSVYISTEQSSQTLNGDDMSLTKMSISQTTNNDKLNEATTNVYNEYSNTDKDVQITNFNDVKSSSDSSTIYTEYTNKDHNTTTSNNGMFSLDPSTVYGEYINTSKNKENLDSMEISSKEKPTVYGSFVGDDRSTESLSNDKYLIETSPALDKQNHTDRNTIILIDGEIITENNKFESIGDDILNNNILFNSSPDESDYLIKVDNSANIEPFQQSEYPGNTTIEDDYLIIVRNLNHEPNLNENTTDSKLETVYNTTQTDNNFKTLTESQTTNTLDPIVAYIDEEFENNRNQELTSSEDESFHNIKLSDSGEDKSDYLIIADNSTNIVTNHQNEHIDITNVDNDYLIVVRDFNNNKNVKNNIPYNKYNILDNKLKDIYPTTPIEIDVLTETIFEDFEEEYDDSDLVVAYINKREDNMKLKDSILTQHESLNNIKILNSDEDGSDYLIKVDNFTNTKTAGQYENTDSTIADQDYLIIVRNFNDQQNINENFVHKKLKGFHSTSTEPDNTKDAENYKIIVSTENVHEDNI